MAPRCSITVIIPTYMRVHSLAKCLLGIQNQTLLPQQTIVVVRKSDHDTQNFFSQHSSDFNNIFLQIVMVEEPGQIAALNTGLAHATNEIVSFTDDDAIAHNDWLERIEEYFRQNSQIAGVGGRDFLYLNNQLLHKIVNQVGQITWYGRIIGNHHLGTGNARQVMHLKGVNMSFRRALIQSIGFNKYLWGQGAQYRNELGLCLTLHYQGWQIFYDPAIAVDHYPGVRHDEEKRNEFQSGTVINASHNEMLTFLSNLRSWQRWTVILYCLFIGTILAPGIVQWLRLLLTKQPNATERLWSSLQGRCQGFCTWRKSKLK